MRIGMMADLYKPHISGVTNYIDLNKRYLEGCGHEVYVFTFGREAHPEDGVNVVRSPGVAVFDTGFHFTLSHNNRARKLIKSMDIVHVNHPFISGTLAVRYCRSKGIPIVFTNHTRYDLYAQAYLPILPDIISLTALEAFMPAFCRFCALVISPSPGMREVLVRLGVDSPIEVIPNGVDLIPFQAVLQPIDRQEYGFSSEDVIFIFVGRLGPEKNIPFLLRAFADTLQASQRARLLLVGDGPEGESFRTLVNEMGLRDQVIFTGSVAYSEIPRFMTMADAFVTASVTEVHPLTVIEAMAAGLPVLGIRSPGVGDTIIDGETGFIISEQDVASFTAQMVRLIVDQDLRHWMGEQAKRVSQQYDINRTGKLLLDRYHQLVERAVIARQQ